MTTTLQPKSKALRDFLTDDQILEVMILAETRKIDACKLLQTYMFPKWHITVLEAMGILQGVLIEWSGDINKKRML